ncbi:MAG: cytochrome C [Nitrospirae bacterium]|nr:cytochrome C [Nitrospirota bacterium]
MKCFIQIIAFAFTFVFACISYAGIANTVHNMSISGPGVIKAATETEICVFCHTPHNAQPGRPLWNHDMPTSGYTMYGSEYLQRADYPLPLAIGTTTGTPGMLSRQCLSCHDGTVAVGAVYMVRGTILGNNLIAMSGVTGSGAIPTTATGYIGTDLTRHHPVGIEYNPSITISFGSGIRTIELISNPTSMAMKLYTISAKNYVECSSCHDSHIDTGYSKQKFLRDTTGGTLAAKISNTCSACHNKTGWTGSIHQTTSNAYSDANVNTTFDTSTTSSLVCMNCHRTHKGIGAPYLLRQAEEATCFQGASNLANETACHGTSATAATNNIQTVITKTYKHPTTPTSGKHTNLDVLYPLGGTPPGSLGLNWSNARHAECVDCHNPHRAKNTPARVGTSSWYPTSVDSTSNWTAKSGALTGVTGVQPTWPSIWTVPTTFTTQESSTYEYQICFKCHSYWALRDGDGVTTYTTASGVTVTDQAMEFNPNNKSAHPVVVTLNNQTGSYAPKPLTSSQMSSPWSTILGNQTMYCSDCHGADNEASGDPKGLHGSSYKYMLKGNYRYWPLRNDGQLWKLSDKNNFTSYGGLFCKNCHPVYDGTWKNNVHSQSGGGGGGEGKGSGHQDMTCVNCHVAVPHGSKRSRFIGYGANATSPDPAPYNYGGNSLKVTGFKKAATPTSYGGGMSMDNPNCATSGASGCHSSSITNPDP